MSKQPKLRVRLDDQTLMQVLDDQIGQVCFTLRWSDGGA